MESTIQIIIENVFKYGLSAALLVGLIVAIGFFIWKIGIKISDHTVKTLTSISETNKKFAESSSVTAELIKIQTQQGNATLDQLKFIKQQQVKQNSAAIEFMNIFKSMASNVDEKNRDPEVIIRIENVIKELQRQGSE